MPHTLTQHAFPAGKQVGVVHALPHLIHRATLLCSITAPMFSCFPAELQRADVICLGLSNKYVAESRFKLGPESKSRIFPSIIHVD